VSTDVLRDDVVQLPAGPRLAIRRGGGSKRPFLLVHGLSSNARLWDGVAHRLVAAGHEVLSVDLRGHGRSEQTADGYTTDQCADDLAALCLARGLTGDREPVVAGQSWGGNVAVSLAARHDAAAAVALVDGGWIALGDRFATFDECWAVLAPPVFDGLVYDDLPKRIRGWHPDWPDEGVEGTLANFARLPDGTAAARLTREHHREILHSMWELDPRPLFPKVTVPALVAAAVPHDPADPRRVGPRTALELLPDATVSWYVDADHDLHAQRPERLVADLLVLADRAEAARR
jgi:pimeloyl-ACP methyl ester carboxylesterase